MKVHWRAFPLHPDTPEEGQSLEDMFRTTPEKISGIIKHLQETAESLDLPFGTRSMTYNSRLAQELGLWATNQGKGEPFHLAAFKAYFVDGQNLAKHSVLLELAQSVGLKQSEALEILTNRAYSDEVDKDWADSRFKGVTAVPTFIMGQHKLVGAQTFEAIEELITLYGSVKR